MPTTDDVRELFSQLDNYFPEIDFGSSLPSLAETVDGGASPEQPRLRSVSTSTEVQPTRDVAMGDTVLVNKLETVRSYEQALKLPAGVSTEQLYGLFRQNAGLSAGTLALRLAVSAALERPLSGEKHELVESV